MFEHLIEHLKPHLEFDGDGPYTPKDGVVMMYDNQQVLSIDTIDGYIILPAGRDDIKCVDLTEANVKEIEIYFKKR